MDVKDFCSAMESEMTAWKAKMYDAMRKIDKLGSAEKEKILMNVQDLNMIMDDMAQRVEKVSGAVDLVLRTRNSRLASSPMRASQCFTSTSPEAERSPSRIRALSRSVWSRPTIHVPALDMIL